MIPPPPPLLSGLLRRVLPWLRSPYPPCPPLPPSFVVFMGKKIGGGPRVGFSLCAVYGSPLVFVLVFPLSSRIFSGRTPNLNSLCKPTTGTRFPGPEKNGRISFLSPHPFPGFLPHLRFFPSCPRAPSGRTTRDRVSTISPP